MSALPDSYKGAKWVAMRLPDLTFSFHAEEDALKLVKMVLDVAIEMTIDTCMREVRAYDPMGYQDSAELKDGITENLRFLKNAPVTRRRGTS